MSDQIGLEESNQIVEQPKKKRGGLSVAIFAILAKMSKLLKVFKFFKVAKPLVLLISMSISAIAYAFMLGPWLAILFVVLLLVHEMGHVAAMKMKGFDTPTPVFIPFLGAAIFAPKFKDRHTEAFVGYGGPLLGTVGALIVFGLWCLSPKDTPLAHILLVGSYLGTFLNLFNLLPISPLDGGRVTQAVGTWFRYIGLFGLAVFSIAFRQPVILYVWILVLFDLEVIPVRLRGTMITGCWIAMATLMSLGYGDQPVWVNILDCVITSPFVIVSLARAFGSKLADDEPDNRPGLTKKQRIEWFVLYFILGLVLMATIMIQYPYLPKQ